MARRDQELQTPAPKRDRMEVRVSAEQKATFQHAAALEGRSLSDFVVESTQRHAEEVIREHAVLRLSERDSRIFAEAILNPAPPNDKLRAAYARYRREVVED